MPALCAPTNTSNTTYTCTCTCISVQCAFCTVVLLGGREFLSPAALYLHQNLKATIHNLHIHVSVSPHMYVHVHIHVSIILCAYMYM